VISLTGLPERNRDLHTVPLDKIFIKLTMQVQRTELSQRRLLEEEAIALEKGDTMDKERLRALQVMRRESESPPTQSLSIADTLHQHRRLIIIGAPGSGKTTLMQWLAVTFAKQLQGQADYLGPRFAQPRVPIVLELRRFAMRLQELAQSPATFSLAEEISGFVDQDARFPGITATFISEALSNGQCLLLLDGLDEVFNHKARQRLLEAIEAFASTACYAENLCILTTRPYGFQQLNLRADFQRAEVQPFTPEDVAHFIQHWYDTAYAQFDPNKAKTEAQELTGKIRQSERVRALARNPLLCTIIAIVYRNNRVLPNRRVVLYEKCCEALLETWERDRFCEESSLIGSQLGWTTKLDLLARVAYWLHQQTERLAAPEDQIEAQLVNGLEELRQTGTPFAKPIADEAHDFIVAVRNRSGLLQGRGDGTLEFMHRTFQEYLTARYMASFSREACIDQVMTHLHEAWWQEVHLLTIAHLGTHRGENADTASRLLLEILHVYKPPSRWLLAPNRDWLSWFKLGKWLPRWQWQRRIAWHLMREFELAAQGFADCAPEARTQAVSKALSQIAVERTSQWLHDPFYSEHLTWITEIVAQFLPSHSRLVDIVLPALQDKNNRVRAAAAESLGNLGVTDESVISALVAALQDEKEQVRREAAASLGRLGVTDDSVISALVAALQDEDDSARALAFISLGNLGVTDSLGNLGVTNDSVISALVAALQDKDDEVREDAAGSLGLLGVTDDLVISALVAALQDEKEWVRQKAVESLGRLGVTDESVISALVAALQDEKERVRREAAASLGHLGVTDESVISALVAALQDKDDEVREDAAGSLGLLGVTDDLVISALVAALQDKDDGVRGKAANSLGHLGVTDESVISALVAALQDKKEWVRQKAVESLGLLGVTDDLVVSALVAALQDENNWVRQNAVESLGRLGVTDKSVISALVAALQDKNEWVRWNAAKNLGQLKIKDETQLQQLLITLQSLYDDKRNDLALEPIRKQLNGRKIPCYRWHSLEKRQQKWQQFKSMPFKKLSLIILVGVLVWILGADFTLLGAFVALATAVTIFQPILFPSK
jgi:HEAT repeat protein/energy-coupling factor transporter ATP-binding protein EcfA2